MFSWNPNSVWYYRDSFILVRPISHYIWGGTLETIIHSSSYLSMVTWYKRSRSQTTISQFVLSWITPFSNQYHMLIDLSSPRTCMFIWKGPGNLGWKGWRGCIKIEVISSKTTCKDMSTQFQRNYSCKCSSFFKTLLYIGHRQYTWITLLRVRIKLAFVYNLLYMHNNLIHVAHT